MAAQLVALGRLVIHYTITTHAHLPGARLSKSGQWGNMPHQSVEAAKAAAEADARGQPHVIRQQSFPALPGFRANGGGPLTAPKDF